MKRAGHSNFKTTQAYIDLAGETFRAESVRAEERLFGGSFDASREHSSTKKRYQTDDLFADETT